MTFNLELTLLTVTAGGPKQGHFLATSHRYQSAPDSDTAVLFFSPSFTASRIPPLSLFLAEGNNRLPLSAHSKWRLLFLLFPTS